MFTVKLLVDCGLLEHYIDYILILCLFYYELTVNADIGNIVQCPKEDIKSDLYVVDHPSYTKSGFYFQLECSQAGRISTVNCFLDTQVCGLDEFLTLVCVHECFSLVYPFSLSYEQYLVMLEQLLPSVPWYQERRLHHISFGSLMVIVLTRTVKCNLYRLQVHINKSNSGLRVT